MLDPAPTTAIDKTFCRGVVDDVHAATATAPARVRVSFHNLNYALDLVPAPGFSTEPGEKIIGRITADAKRVDKVSSGGRYVEPVIGRPRRVQGLVVAIDAEANAIVVDAGAPIRCILTDARQRATDFEIADFVSFDVLRGATITDRP